MNLFTFGECRVCDTPCIWFAPVDGVLADFQVCCPECLEKLLEELDEKGEVEGEQ